MALKRKLTTAPETAIASLYKKVSETEWVLDLEGDDTPDPRLREMRDNNINLAKERDELQAKLRAAEENAQKTAPKVKESESLAQEVERLKKEWTDSQTKAAQAEARARQEQFRGSFLQTATKHKVRDETAAKTLWALASTVYKENKEGAFVPLGDDGRPLYSKKDITQTMPIEEWIETHKSGDYRDLFAQPLGGGAKGPGVLAGGKTPKILITPDQVSSGAYIEQLASGEAAVSE
jgi:alanyl-tRNA synthetase